MASEPRWYTDSVLDETTFRRHAEAALQLLKKALIQAESEAGFEVEEQSGALKITFDEPPSKFLLTPNMPMRQIWINTASNSLKLDWDETIQRFVLAKTGESLNPLVGRLITEHVGGGEIILD